MRRVVRLIQLLARIKGVRETISGHVEVGSDLPVERTA